MPDTTNFDTIGAEVRSGDPVHEAARRLAVEAIGTFFVVCAVGATARSGTVLAPLAAGVVLMVMVHADERVSGGHYDPQSPSRYSCAAGSGPALPAATGSRK